ncbi:unnamed protein product [Cunninghamella echinulata]
MGSCCSTRSKDQGYTLGGGSNSTNQPKTATTQGQLLSSGQVVGNSANGREAMLAAAEQRRLKAETRGVQQGGGVLSKKLNEQRGKKPEPEQRSKEPDLVWD